MSPISGLFISPPLYRQLALWKKFLRDSGAACLTSSHSALCLVKISSQDAQTVKTSYLLPNTGLVLDTSRLSQHLCFCALWSLGHSLSVLQHLHRAPFFFYCTLPNPPTVPRGHPPSTGFTLALVLPLQTPAASWGLIRDVCLGSQP